MNITKSVGKIIDDVRLKGDAAVVFYTKKFDAVELKPQNLRVTPAEIKSAVKNVDGKTLSALKSASMNIRKYCETEFGFIKRKWEYKRAGLTVGEFVSPVESAAVYVPGGRYSYPSSVLMTAIPARVAGVKKIIMLTPPNNLTPAVMAAAALASIDEIYRVGGVQGIAAAAFGTRRIPKVDIIVGPGNKYVTEAKRQLFGTVGIDMLAGPSEVVVISDGSTPADFVANDLLAQCEHDPSSRAFLFSDSKKLIDKVKKQIPPLFKKQIVIKKVSIGEAVRMSNEIAPEHLELLVKSPEKILKKISNAAAVFMGVNTPTALGDYFAGPSHVLPTSGSARFSSGLSVGTFLKKISVISAKKSSLKNCASHIVNLAGAEGLYYHAESVKIRV